MLRPSILGLGQSIDVRGHQRIMEFCDYGGVDSLALKILAGGLGIAALGGDADVLKSSFFVGDLHRSAATAATNEAGQQSRARAFRLTAAQSFFHMSMIFRDGAED